ncbi:MAG: 2-oxoacid:acceptor oxidoreductase family protein [Sedimentibacter sp.]|uniref:2-oxoacid:acceptor oxidoreductase family protein n=1 Tax=Sedimentibacter sp. TaxID=1960295 RepID=UPI003158146B
MKEIIFAGAGGQGVLTSGLLISQIAVFKKYHATWIPQYGSAMRGGTANCTVKFGKEYIYNPSQEEPDILLAMNTPSYNKFLPFVKPGGTVIINSDMVVKEKVRDDVNFIEVPCLSMAKELNHPQGANIIMAGIIVKISGDFTEEEGFSGMNDMFKKKGKEKYEELNTKAFKKGYSFI